MRKEKFTMKTEYIIKYESNNITIPKEIIEKLHIKKGDLLLIKIQKVYGEIKGNTIILSF